jgi:hypothetical protein
MTKVEWCCLLGNIYAKRVMLRKVGSLILQRRPLAAEWCQQKVIFASDCSSVVELLHIYLHGKDYGQC